MRWNDGKRKKESKSSKQPAASQQYIYQYKIQNIVPNTFSNKESIAQEDSLHNQLKNFISYPLIVWGGGGGGGVSCFYSFGEPLTDGLTQCLCIDRALLYS